MDSRRTVLKKLIVGTATAAGVPGAAAAATDVLEQSAAAAGIALPTGPAPWWLFSPLGLGTPLRFGWYVSNLSPVSKGASVLTLSHSSGRKARVHLCAHNGRPHGVAHSRLVDLVLMDGSSGSDRTDERLGRVVLGLAERIRRNEVNADGDLRGLVRMMTHNQRIETFGADSLV